MQIFHSKLDPGAHTGFRDWHRANPDGFFLNLKTERSGLIHRVDCLHLADCDFELDTPAWSITKTPKICSGDLKAIEAWAAQHSVTSRYCRDCNLP